MITTILTLRAPGMTMFRMPIFTWNILVTSLLVIMVFPLLAAALLALLADRMPRRARLRRRPPAAPMLWQHLFWFFGHPEVYIVALPFFGIITEVIPVFSRKPIFGYKGLVGATLAIAALSMSVWAHHMFATGQVLLPFFSFLSFLIAVPTGMKFFNWIGTMWRGPDHASRRRCCSRSASSSTFLFGGLSGVLLASPPIDFHVSDSYFVVAHFHYVLFGTIVFAVYAGIYFWFPKMFGRMLDERLGKVHFWLTFDRLPHDVPGAALAGHRGHAPPVRRLPADATASPRSTRSPRSARSSSASRRCRSSTTCGSRTRPARWSTVDDPWGHGNSLEWATSCPPPLRNFDRMPRIRSERPAFDAKFPDLAAGPLASPAPPEGGAKPLTSESDGGATYSEDTAGQRRPLEPHDCRSWQSSSPAGAGRGGLDCPRSAAPTSVTPASAELRSGPRSVVASGPRRRSGPAAPWWRSPPGRRPAPSPVRSGRWRCPPRPPRSRRARAARRPGRCRRRAPSKPEYAAACSPLWNTASTRPVSSAGWKSAPAVPTTQCGGHEST